MHSENRKGKHVKTERTIKKSRLTYELPALLEKAYQAKVAEGLADGTLERYARVHSFLIEFLKIREYSQDVRQLSVDICREFVTWLRKERPKFEGHKYKKEVDKTAGVSPRYVNDLIKTIRTSFRVLKEDHLITENPFESVKTVEQSEKLINVLTVDELKALLNAPNQRQYAEFRDYVVMSVLIDTMARISEVLTLTVDDVDLNAREVVFRPEQVKTRRGRIIPIQQRTARLLKELISEVSEFDSEYIFLANYGEPLTPNNFRHRLSNYAQKVGIKKHVHPHLLRHSAATIYLENGGNLRYLQALLGHVDLRMTSRYTHLSKQSIAENHEQFSALGQVVGKLNKNRKIKR